MNTSSKTLRNDIIEIFSNMGKDLPGDQTGSISAAGILDSISILELVNALEDRFEIAFDEDDLTLENFDTLSRIEQIVLAQLGASGE